LNSVAVVTGTTHGIGRVTARELAKAGYTVVMLCRNLAAAAAVRSEIIGQLPRASVHAIRCDLASLGSVRACAEAVRNEFERIALLIDSSLSNLPPFLAHQSGINSGFMIAHVTAASLASENKSLAGTTGFSRSPIAGS